MVLPKKNNFSLKIIWLKITKLCIETWSKNVVLQLIEKDMYIYIL